MASKAGEDRAKGLKGIQSKLPVRTVIEGIWVSFFCDKGGVLLDWLKSVPIGGCRWFDGKGRREGDNSSHRQCSQWLERLSNVRCLFPLAVSSPGPLDGQGPVHLSSL